MQTGHTAQLWVKMPPESSVKGHLTNCAPSENQTEKAAAVDAPTPDLAVAIDDDSRLHHGGDVFAATTTATSA